MGLTKDYLRYVRSGVCNIIGSPNGAVQCVDDTTSAVAACESVVFYNMRTLEKSNEITSEKKTVTAFKMNRDKSVIAVGYNDGEIHLHKRKQGEKTAVFAGHRTGVNCLAFSNDGLTLASGGKDSTIIVWDIVNESGLFKLMGHKGSITQLQFTEDSEFLVSSSKDYQIKFWSMSTQSCFYTLAENVSEVYAFSLINADRILIIGSAELELLVFELNWLNHIEENGAAIFSSVFNETAEKPTEKKARNEKLPGSDFIEEANDQGNTIMKCKKRGTLIRQAKGRALQLCLSNDGSVLCCVGGDSLVDVYRIFTPEESQKRFHRKLRKEKKKESGEIDSNDTLEHNISRDVTLLVTRIGGFRGESKIKWMDFCPSRKYLADENATEYRIYCLLNTNDVHGMSLKINNKSGETEGVSLVSLSRRGHRSDVTSLSTSSDGSKFLSGATESAILWDFNSLLPMNCFTAENMKCISACLFSPSDKEIILCTKDGSVFLFDLAECALIQEHNSAHDGSISCVVHLPDKSGFVTCGSDKKAIFWHYQTVNQFGRSLLSVKVERVLDATDEILCAAISPNSKFIVLGLLDNTARIFYLDTLKFFATLYGHSLPVFSIDVSPDSKLIATGSGDKTVKIWGSDFADCHKSLFAHDDTVTFVKFGVDKEEQLLWSAGKDGKIKQWDAIKFHRVQVLEGHTEEIRALTQTLDGNTLISASHDKSIRLWDLSDEIIVLQEEEEQEREKEYDEKLVDIEDVIPGEARDREVDLAPVKTIDSIKSTEKILEAIDILRNELIERESDPTHVPHVLLAKYSNQPLEFFMLDSLQEIRSSHLEKSLLMVPLSYVPDILRNLCACVKHHHKPELSCRVILFLLRIHHSQIINSTELLPIVDELRSVLPSEIAALKDQIGFNLAALQFLQMQIEERDNVKLFRDVSQIRTETAKKAKRSKKKVKDVALVKTIV